MQAVDLIRPLAGPGPKRNGRLGLPLSLAAHAVIIAVLIVSRTEPPFPEADEVTPVDVISQAEFEAAAGRSEPARDPPAIPPTIVARPGATLRAPPSGPASDDPAAPPRTDDSAAVQASRLYSAEILASPKSRRAREKLAHVEISTRLEQICGIEAMAQLSAFRKDLQPSRVVAYATADVRTAGSVLIAPGAAVLSDHRWYRLNFRCTIPPTAQRVTAFEFTLGAEIPKREWEADSLTDQGEMDD